MTKVARLYEEEKVEALEQEAKETAIAMLKDGNSVEKIVRYVKRLSMLQVEELKKELEKIDN